MVLDVVLVQLALAERDFDADDSSVMRVVRWQAVAPVLCRGGYVWKLVTVVVAAVLILKEENAGL